MSEETRSGTCQSPRRVDDEGADETVGVRVVAEADVVRVADDDVLVPAPGGRGAAWLCETMALAFARATAIASCKCIMMTALYEDLTLLCFEQL